MVEIYINLEIIRLTEIVFSEIFENQNKVKKPFDFLVASSSFQFSFDSSFLLYICMYVHCFYFFFSFLHIYLLNFIFLYIFLFFILSYFGWQSFFLNHFINLYKSSNNSLCNFHFWRFEIEWYSQGSSSSAN
jgi:hypothetical protein